MQVSQSIAKLRCPVQHIGLRQKPVILPRLQHQRPQIFARHIIHHQVIPAANREKVGHFGQIGMIQPRQHSGLAQKLLASLPHQFGGQGAVVFHFFEGALPSFQPLIIRQVDAAHPALANNPANPVTAAQHLSGF